MESKVRAATAAEEPMDLEGRLEPHPWGRGRKLWRLLRELNSTQAWPRQGTLLSQDPVSSLASHNTMHLRPKTLEDVPAYCHDFSLF